MTTLIFATHTDASPLIHLEAADVEVITRLIRLRAFALAAEPLTPGRWAVEFLGSLSADERDEWNPRLESTPASDVRGCLELIAGCLYEDEGMEVHAAAPYPDLIAWNPETWEEWDLEALDKAADECDRVEQTARDAAHPLHDPGALFKEIVAICRPESPAIVEATTKALAKALEAEEQRLANPPGFV